MHPPTEREGILCVVSGPSGCGKTTLCRTAAESEGMYYTVSCTTRSMRPGEEHGRDYFFLTDEDFVQRIADGGFLEHAEVHGRRYGTLRSEVIERLAAGQDVVMDLDVQGAAQLRASTDPLIQHSLIDVFILTETVAALEARLAGRRSETPEQLSLRLENARTEMRHWTEYDYTITSRSREEDITAFRAIFEAERLRSRRQRPPILAEL